MTDPLGLVAAAAASAVAAGLATVTATVLVVRACEGVLSLLLLGTLAGVILAGVVAWILLAPLGSTYRRGAFAVVCAFATVVVMLVCIPIDVTMGRPGLIALLVLSTVAAVLLGRRARRLAT